VSAAPTSRGQEHERGTAHVDVTPRVHAPKTHLQRAGESMSDECGGYGPRYTRMSYAPEGDYAEGVVEVEADEVSLP